MITVIAAIMGKYIRLHYSMPGSLAAWPGHIVPDKNKANGMSKGDAQKWGRYKNSNSHHRMGNKSILKRHHLNSCLLKYPCFRAVTGSPAEIII